MSSQGPSERVLIAVPAYNEEGSLAMVLLDLQRHCPQHDVLVVDDGSTDSTAEVARRAGALVCSLPFNLGVGGAMRTAYKFALRRDYDAVVQVDADGQHSAKDVANLITGLNGADVVVGARFAGMGDYRVASAKRIAIRVLASVLGRLAGARLTDATSGFRAANRRAIRIFAAHYPAEYLGDTVESLVIAIRSGCVVVQVPVVMHPRFHGCSSQSAFRAGVYLVRAVVALGFALVRSWPVPDLDPVVLQAE